MKYSIGLMAAGLLMMISNFNVMADEQNKDWAGLNRYAEANAQLGAPKEGEHRVVFLGNSITQGWVNHHPEFFTEHNYIGRGIGGQTSYQFLVRFREDVINLQPEVVVINAGTNDCAENTGPFNIDITFGNIKSMVELAKANGIKVILSSVLPSSAFRWRPEVTDAADRIAALNEKIKAYADENGIPYVDYFTPMVYGPERSLNPAYSNDGVHPTIDGYLVMEEVVVPVIEATIRQ